MRLLSICDRAYLLFEGKVLFRELPSSWPKMKLCVKNIWVRILFSAKKDFKLRLDDLIIFNFRQQRTKEK